MYTYEDLLLDLGISPVLKGFAALSVVCSLREQNPAAKFTYDILTAAGKILGVSWHKIERNCRHAISSTILNYGPDAMIEILRQAPKLDTGTYPLDQFVTLCVMAMKRRKA